jgi:hypothetical protein
MSNARSRTPEPPYCWQSKGALRRIREQLDGDNLLPYALAVYVAITENASELNEDGKLRESRAIGHHADFVVSIGNGTLVVVKNRRGPRDASIPVRLRGELGRFEESNSSDQRTALKRAA